MPKGQHNIPGWLKGEAHGRAILTVDKVIEIRTAWRDLPKELVSGFMRFMSERHGCSITPIQQVVDRATWKDVEIDEVPKPLDKEILAALLERREVNAAARRASRTYTKKEIKCRNEHVDKVATAKRKQAIQRSRSKKQS